MSKELRLKVAEAVQDDVNKGIARIDSGFMKELEINPGDIVEIEGARKTVEIADRAYPGDIGLNIIRMDGDTRRNSKTSIGEIVSVRKVEVKEAKKVVIAPSRKGITVRASPQVFKQGLLGRALVKGDLVSLGGTKRRRTTFSGGPFEEMFSMLDEGFGGFGFGDLKFMVVNTTPAKDAVIITEETEIEFNPQAVDLKEEPVIEVNYEDIGGLGEEIKKVREMVELPLKHPEIFERLGIEAPKGVLLHGPPGTGKTLLAKAVASETNSNFYLINGPEIMSKFYGQSEENLRKKFEEAEKNAPAIIFIDEIDAIATKREETRGDVERRVVAQLLGLMDGLKSRGKVVVIAATNIPNLLDPALRRPGRFDREIEIGVPSRQGRLDVLKIHTRNMPMDKDVKLKELADITHGFVGADLSSLAKEAAMVVLRRILPDLKMDEENPIPKEVLEKLRVTQKDFREALKVVRPSAMREVFVEVPDVTWEDIGGLDNVKKELEEAIEWPLKNPKVFEQMGIRPPRGVLLYGAPGTGKTLIAKAVAKESESNFILVNGPSLLSKWVGESEKAVREVFRKARQTAPTIIFFDEIDSLAPRRHGESHDSGATERVVNQLLTEMDGLEGLSDVVVIAATNRPDLMDPALLRPGRFDRIILTPVPDLKTREKIFSVHTKNMPLDKDVKIKDLAKKTEMYVGADIEAVCREAAMFALREDMKSKKVLMKHFEKALEKVKASVTEEIEDTYEEIKDTLKRAKAKEMKEKIDYFG
ncbi:MAG: CDC48 family AAA ATPase [Nanoarchaeota archaeon]|nr:CDC48 family AAA ATPase [Nanoarchaeota archaeon]